MGALEVLGGLELTRSLSAGHGCDPNDPPGPPPRQRPAERQAPGRHGAVGSPGGAENRMLRGGLLDPCHENETGL
jgi:hypothetical protein